MQSIERVVEGIELANQKVLKTLDWIAIGALVASVLFRLTTVFVEITPALREAAEVARDVLVLVVVLWLFVRTVQATRPPLYRERLEKRGRESEAPAEP
jgi:hypothetical protein